MSKPQNYVYTPKHKRDEKKTSSPNEKNQSRGNYQKQQMNDHRNQERKDNIKYRTEIINLNDTEKELFNTYKDAKKNVVDSFENDYKAALYGSLITTRKIYVEQLKEYQYQQV